VIKTMSEDTGILEAIQDDILAQLGTISQVKTVDAWQGEVSDLLKIPQKLPALNVIYQGGVYEPFSQVGENTSAAMDYLIILIVQNQKARKDALLTAYNIIEQTRVKLTGHWVGEYDFWRPRREELLMAEGSTLVYGLTYGLDQVLTHTD